MNLRPLLVLLLWSSLARADVSPAFLFCDHAVLQREKPIAIWGQADPGEQVTVEFADQHTRTVADDTGRWRVTLTSLPASDHPRLLRISGKNQLVYSDVVVGDVWLASGQSNMEFPLKGTYDAALDVTASDHLPLVRHLKVARAVAAEPAILAKGKWECASASTADRFTAVGFYFARDLHLQLGVPIGIINSTWGGTPVEAWMDADTLSSKPDFAVVDERWADILAEYPEAETRYKKRRRAWQQEQESALRAGQKFTSRPPRVPKGPGDRSTPSGLYNGMIAPLIPYAMQGVIWYQGEANTSRASEYHALFSAMIPAWRGVFGQGDFPFYWVQLANFRASDPNGTDWAFLREAQTQTLTLPGTGQAITIDVGNANNIHPRDKASVGRRLARIALHRSYGMEVMDGGPEVESIEREGPGFRITYTNIGDKLWSPRNELGGFELAGADRVFHPAIAELHDDTVRVSASAVPDPLAVRYAWHNAPAACLLNSEGLPAAPFRTDNW